MTEPLIDPEALKRYSFSVWSYKQGEMVSLMIHIGDRLGLYRAMQGAGPMTAAELAERTGLKERWLFEWLRGQAAARLLDYHDPDRFELTPVGAAVLADETGSLAFAAGAFAPAMAPEIVDKLCDAFRTGIGLSYEQLGPNAAHRTERMLGPWVRQALVPKIIPALERRSAETRTAAARWPTSAAAAVSRLRVWRRDFRTRRFTATTPAVMQSPTAIQRCANRS